MILAIKKKNLPKREIKVGQDYGFFYSSPALRPRKKKQVYCPCPSSFLETFQISF